MLCFFVVEFLPFVGVLCDVFGFGACGVGGCGATFTVIKEEYAEEWYGY